MGGKKMGAGDGTGEEARWGEKPSAKKSRTTNESIAPLKKARMSSSSAAQTVSKTANVSEKDKTNPEDLVPGSVVLYWDDWRGVIRDAFIPINQFWVADEESGELVADDSGELVQFKAEELQLVAPAPVAKPRPPELQAVSHGGVMVLGSEPQMLAALQHFGSPEGDVRNDPQHLLALPCEKCEPQSILQVACDGIDDNVREFAKKLRPDIHVAVRAFHLQKAAEALGSAFLKLDGLYCLGSVQLPFGQDEIDASRNKWERHWRRDVCNQVDVCVTAGDSFPDEDTPEDAARRALGEKCGIAISDLIWGDTMQRALRRKVSFAERLPLQFTDVNGMRVFVLLLPEDAVVSHVDGILRFDEEPSVDCTRLAKRPRIEEPELDDDCPRRPPSASKPQQLRPSHAARRLANIKDVRYWESAQDEFAGLPPLPPDWIRVRSKSSCLVYFFNTKTHESSFDTPACPLPPGWKEMVSKSTGKTYYFNASKNLSQFEIPTE
eukprot:TRINITY_DN51366_c0_g1_i1.p1 TRINITY_DN51366_c0_g1~~TRINITY_DN51366_c0_g1_i1.p1  ORF type:complete len:494 (-),score=93.20 TRINITY_DN51366_c0_g1_i1:185-1666(-)